MHSNSNKIEGMTYDNANEAIEVIFESLLEVSNQVRKINEEQC